jgi:hypothetical protein
MALTLKTYPFIVKLSNRSPLLEFMADSDSDSDSDSVYYSQLHQTQTQTQTGLLRQLNQSAKKRLFFIKRVLFLKNSKKATFFDPRQVESIHNKSPRGLEILLVQGDPGPP